jgi:hypothetical protein
VPAADDVGTDYFEKFKLDYDCEDNVRMAGSTRGLIPEGKLSNLPTNDPFIKWLNEHLEIGPEDLTGRVKPYYVRSVSMTNTPVFVVLSSSTTISTTTGSGFWHEEELKARREPGMFVCIAYLLELLSRP